MAKILGLDLGTNSIGWAIRETEEELNQIIDSGVLIFEKGVGNGKSGEYSLAAERRKNRGKRRLYNAKRYRKWALLKVLIENGMCPLSMDELRLWSVGNWKQEYVGKWKNKGRIYPLTNTSFQNWLAFDPAIFGSKGSSLNGKLMRKNPYDLRCELIDTEETNENLKKLKIGRALYHLVQRRGFKSNRKNGKSNYAENEVLKKRKEENSNFHIALLAKEKLDKGERFRASGVFQRHDFEEEFNAICDKQNLCKELILKLHKAIYFVRPLRSQKGLVGNCTLEKGKPRIPISHPKFEEFRALQFINNIKWREVGTQNFEAIPMSLKKEIFENLFFRRITRGDNKGKVNAETSFKFEDIVKIYSKNGQYEFNFKNMPNVSTCPFIASLMNVFEKEWETKFIQDSDNFGINWDGLAIAYKAQDYKGLGRRLKRKVVKGNVTYIPVKLENNKVLHADEIWHLLFDYLQTKDKQEELRNFCKDVLGFDEEKATEFSNIDIPQGYGSLSYKAIVKILPFLQQGYIYSEAVTFANLKKIFGDQFEQNKEQAKKIIATTIMEVGATKENLNIVNGLIQKYFSENEFPNSVGLDEEIVYNAYKKECDNYIIENWQTKTHEEKEYIWKLYAKFLNGDQTAVEKASGKPTIDYFKLPRLDETIKQRLKDNFNLPERDLTHLYHPSDIDMYPVSMTEKEVSIDGYSATIPLLESPQPPSKGWKNPMAMRTLHELRHLLNYLLMVGKITKETKIVVEMARELNDANKRWAIQTYQRYREEENIEFAKAIVGVVKEKYPNLNEKDIENVNQVRLWWEQIENNEEIYKQIKDLKEDVQKFRLWKEQECTCMYTGRMINITNLFDGTQTQIMHTFPVSKSFDSSLANLTVGDAFYNNHIQGNKIPTQLENYSKDVVINGKTYTAIEPRLKKWKAKAESLKKQIDKIKTRGLDPEVKKNAIQKKRLLQLHYDYWNKKVASFTAGEIPASWKNSQLVDTQIISKYARAYLKTVFQKVEVQKGTITDIFKKIYQIKGDDKKDRSKHSHHAIDAATLTLIPGSARREAILAAYYTAEEKKLKYHTKPYPNFQTLHLLDIENKVIIKHVPHEKTLTKTFKKITIYKKGKKVTTLAQGDNIRGQLHEETYLGAIKSNITNKDGLAIKDNSTKKYLTKQANGKDVIWVVQRKKIEEVDIDAIVDEALKKHIQAQLESGTNISDVKDFNGNHIRHIRYKKFSPSYDKSIRLKKHIFVSKYAHKNYYLANNETNFLCLLYQGKDKKNKEIRAYRFINLFEFSKLKTKQIFALKDNPEYSIHIKFNRNDEYKLSLKNILQTDQKIILFKESIDEIDKTEVSSYRSRVYKIYKFNNSGSDYVFLESILEARTDEELKKAGYSKDGDTEFIPEKYQPRLKLTAEKLNCLFEGIDFEMNLDGSIIFKERAI